jgi:glycosyltransferase involved in cell wall biosynthesis
MLIPMSGSKSRQPTVTVVVPTLNEAKNIPLILGELPAEYEIVVVDGNSTDGTPDVVRQVRPDARIISHRRKGKGDALACGFAAARGDIIVMFDADGSADPKEIALFVHALREGADFAKGSRFLKGGGSSDITLLRRLGNSVLTGLVNAMFGTRYTDLCYGYNAFWRHCLEHIEVGYDGFEVETAINIQIARADLRVTEVPSFEYDRIHGTSNLHAFRDGRRVVRTIAAEFIRPKRGRRLQNADVTVLDLAVDDVEQPALVGTS